MSTNELMNRALSAAVDSAAPLTVELLHDLIEPSELPEPLGIAEVAELLGISTHTLRYYERCGLIDVDRDGLKHRRYDSAAVRRLVFLTRMRLSGMPMRDLRRYVALVDSGDQTVPERLEMLVAHRDAVHKRIRELQLSLVATEYKIATYGGATGP
ncbi:MerR family transcriptional regulator [Rhodococcus fascians]|uniref:MerR family transcriptional regulator n=1 Tax=Rhodococcoides fascians TaxID=1828 RepID=UPI001960BABE|nr:MerR family transcriptional regulator [Rhodococcus fascians]MBM7244936.1 MerR family transcriptional regulator [Rhodococcus fascians]MBY3810869.1 MerR family transcriptional regulator [Rhodococcus fascians]MBY3842218.1 MerR family transcriptional regulator [Rhodococcus fascians]MBY3848056.1 MerR family transcriptional regulator [Rhodococcus fascians]MBY3852563.1 MerR family transcriptional regulator [Rhodococcus fascians]